MPPYNMVDSKGCTRIRVRIRVRVKEGTRIPKQSQHFVVTLKLVHTLVLQRSNLTIAAVTKYSRLYLLRW